jgi:hypothetical protein
MPDSLSDRAKRETLRQPCSAGGQQFMAHPSHLRQESEVNATEAGGERDRPYWSPSVAAFYPPRKVIDEFSEARTGVTSLEASLGIGRRAGESRYLENQISTTSGGSTGTRPDRTRPGGGPLALPGAGAHDHLPRHVLRLRN